MNRIALIKLLRKTSNMTLEDIGTKGLSKWTYIAIENLTNKAGRKHQRIIADLFDLNSKTIFAMDGFAITVGLKEIRRMAIQLRIKRKVEVHVSSY